MILCALVLVVSPAPILAADPPPLFGPGDNFDEAPAPLLPQQPRTETDEDRMAAEVLYSHGRLLAQRGDKASALRRYQRAWRYDPSARFLLGEIVSLAFRLDRTEEALRYAVIAAEIEPRDPAILRRLARHLVDQNQPDRALNLYEKALQSPKQDESSRVSLLLTHCEMGRLCSLMGQHEEAVECFAIVNEALRESADKPLDDKLTKALTDDNGRTFTIMADSFLSAGMMSRAEELYRKAHEEQNDEARLAYNLARIDVQRGEFESALNKITDSFEAHPEGATAEACELLGELLEKTNVEPAAARREYIESLERLFRAGDGQDETVGLALAEQLTDSAQLERAQSVYEELQSSGASFKARLGLVEVARLRGDAEQLLSVLADAAEAGDSLSALESPAEKIAGDAELLDKVLTIAKARNDQAPAALQPGDALAASHLALTAQRHEAADEFFQAFLKLSTDDSQERLIDWGLQLLLADQPQRSAAAFGRALDEPGEPDDKAFLNFQLATALAFAGDTKAALEAAREALRLDPDNPQFFSREAWVLYRADRFDEAVASYHRLIDRFDENHRAPRLRQIIRDARLALSSIHLRQQRTGKAVERAEQVLDEFPEYARALNDLGYLWADRGEHLNRALAMISRAVAAEPENAAYRDSLGWTYYRLGRFNDAVRELEIAADADPDGVILDHLGDAYLQIDDHGKALTAWKDAADAFQRQGDQSLLEATRRKIKNPPNQAPKD